MKCWLCVLLLSVISAEAAKILAIFYFPGKSLYLGGTAFVKILADRGHNVTLVSPFGNEDHPKNYREVVLHEVKDLAKDWIENSFDFNIHPYYQTYQYSKITLPLINSTLSNPDLRQILNTEKFDLVIIDQLFNDGLAYISHLLDAPLILYSSVDSSSWTNSIVGNPAPPSYVPDVISSYSSEMTFLQRLDNSIMFVINELIRHFIVLPAHNEFVRQNFPEAPDISTYQHRASLVFLNGHPSINQPVPKVPAMIDIGGFHIEPPKALPEELAKILNSAKHGVILFSMGSIIESEKLPNKTLNALINTFSELKQTILWKWGREKPQGLPKNVVIWKWIPQSDVLAHKNVRLFITHGGIRSSQETAYRGVPCLAIPVFADQRGNSKRATLAGYARSIELEEITKETLLPILNDLLYNNKYTEAAKNISILMRDRIASPADTIAFWVDYVIRHKGADHLKVASLKLYWFQYLLLDVVLFILICVILLFLAVKYLVRTCSRIFTNRKRKTD